MKTKSILAGLSLFMLSACGGWVPAPAAVRTAVVNSTCIDVSWDKQEGATAYILFRNGRAIQLDTNSVADAGLVNGTRYCYQIAAVEGYEESAVSAAACANTPGVKK